MKVTIKIVNSKTCSTNAYEESKKILAPISTEKQKEPKISDSIDEFYHSLLELKLSRDRYKNRLSSILKNGSPDLDHYLPEIRQIHKQNKLMNNPFLLELLDVELEADFKIFIIGVKAVLDRLIKIFNAITNQTLNTFAAKGDKLIKLLRNNKPIEKSDSLANYIEEEKKRWLNEILANRDTIVHYSKLNSYTSFLFPLTHELALKLTNVNSMRPPMFSDSKDQYPANEYIDNIFTEVIEFCTRFIAEIMPDIKNK